MGIVVLLSGGLDSSLMTKLIIEETHNVFPLFINYGQINYNKELEACHNLCKSLNIENLKIINISDFGNKIPSGLTASDLHINKDAFLPNRNGLLLLIASSYAYQVKAKYIALGLLNDKNSIFPDQTREFLDAFEKFINASLNKEIKVLSPFMAMTKSDVIKLAKEKHIDYSYSCHAGTNEPCGICISCLEFINSKN